MTGCRPHSNGGYFHAAGTTSTTAPTLLRGAGQTTTALPSWPTSASTGHVGAQVPPQAAGCRGAATRPRCWRRHTALRCPRVCVRCVCGVCVRAVDTRAPRLCPRPLPAAPYEFSYSSASSKSSYILNTNPMNQADAEQFCRDNGMHLVTWESAAEQNEVRRRRSSSHCPCRCCWRRRKQLAASTPFAPTTAKPSATADWQLTSPKPLSRWRWLSRASSSCSPLTTLSIGWGSKSPR